MVLFCFCSSDFQRLTITALIRYELSCIETERLAPHYSCLAIIRPALSLLLLTCAYILGRPFQVRRNMIQSINCYKAWTLLSVRPSILSLLLMRCLLRLPMINVLNEEVTHYILGVSALANESHFLLAHRNSKVPVPMNSSMNRYAHVAHIHYALSFASMSIVSAPSLSRGFRQVQQDG